jgi:hypothetical protein
MFLMPMILGASALAAVPVVVHLMRRQEVTPVSWGAMQFLLETPLKMKRRRSIDNWLLLLVRMAILLSLAFLLSRPVVQNATLVSTTPVDVAIVLDHSLTMGKVAAQATPAAGGGGGAAAKPAAAGATLFDNGLATAEKLARMLPPSATVSVVLAEHSPIIVTPTPIKLGITARDARGEPRGEWAKTLQYLHQLTPGMTKANIPAAVGAARELVAHGYNPRKVILIISDDQRSNWYPADDSLWKLAAGPAGTASSSLAIYSLPLAHEMVPASAPNISVRAIAVTPAFLGVRRPSQVVATVTNTGGTDLSAIPLQLAVDGRQVTTQSLASLPAGQSATVSFDYNFPESGAHWVRIHADLVDSLEADNAAVAAVQVYPRLPVLIVDGQLTASGRYPQADFLAATMTADAIPFVEPRIISVAQLGAAAPGAGGAGAAGGGGVRFEDFPIVILNDVPRLPRDLLERLAEHVQHGNGLWILLGGRTEQPFLEALGKSPLAAFAAQSITRAPLAGGAATAPDAPAGFVGIDIREPSNPALTALLASERNAFAGASLQAWWQLTPGPMMRTILATTTGDPLVLEQDIGKAGGRVVLWTTPFGNTQWNNFPFSAGTFVPLINETLFHLAAGQESGQPRQLDAGAPLIWSGPASRPIDAATLLAPNGTRRTLQPQLRGDSYLVTDKETNLPGLYELRFTAPPRNGATAPPTVFFSVNIDRTELDPALLTPNDLDWFRRQGVLKSVLTQETLPTAFGAQPGGVEIWWVLGLLLLTLLVVEVVMTRNLARQQSGESLRDSGLDRVLPGAVRRTSEPVLQESVR